MAHGYPDFGIKNNETTIKLLDLGELSARLGCISRYDRAGTILYMDDGNFHLAPYIIYQDDNQVISRVVDGVLASGSAIQIANNRSTQLITAITTHIPYYQLNMVGLEFMAKYVAQTTDPYTVVTIIMEVGGEDHDYQVVVSLDYEGKRIGIRGYYKGVLANYYFMGTGLYINRPVWSDYYIHIKVVINNTTGYYSHIVINGVIVDLSEYQLVDLGGADDNQIIFRINTLPAFITTYFYIGDIIITTDEVVRK